MTGAGTWALHPLLHNTLPPYGSLLSGCSWDVSFVINHWQIVKCFPDSMSQFSKLTNLMRGSWRPPICSRSEVHAGQDLWLAPKIKDIFMDGALHHGVCTISQQWCQNWTELQNSQLVSESGMEQVQLVSYSTIRIKYTRNSRDLWKKFKNHLSP